MPETDLSDQLPLALTMGEPGGVGTETTLYAYDYFKKIHRENDAGFFLIDDPVRVEKLARHLNLQTNITTITSIKDAKEAFKTGLPVLPVSISKAAPLLSVEMGTPNKAASKHVLGSIDDAVSLALRGEVAGIVTNPIQKSTLIEAGFKFKGHTEYIGNLTQQADLPKGFHRGPIMMLANQSMRVSLATVHMPLAEVPKAITEERIIEVAIIVAQSLFRDFGIASPVLAVCGLNPHAGEAGQLGTEERDIIAPAIQKLNKSGIRCFGPVPADTMFHEDARAHYHGAIAMYHDQGLIPIKTLAFHSTVNMTLGLPIVRTSPDHGTGLDIAGKGIARPDSLIQAIMMARMVNAQRTKYDAQRQSD